VRLLKISRYKESILCYHYAGFLLFDTCGFATATTSRQMNSILKLEGLVGCFAVRRGKMRYTESITGEDACFVNDRLILTLPNQLDSPDTGIDCAGVGYKMLTFAEGSRIPFARMVTGVTANILWVEGKKFSKTTGFCKETKETVFDLGFSYGRYK